MEKTMSITISRDMALEANFMDASFPDVMSLDEKRGTKAEVKAPSANKLLNKFGSLNDTRKASDRVPAPRKLAIIISRIKPVIRLIIVKPPNVAIDFAKDIFFVVSLLHYLGLVKIDRQNKLMRLAKNH